MITEAVRSEWIKLRTVRANVVIALVGVLVPLGFTILIASTGSFGPRDGQETFAATVLIPGYLCVFLAGVVGVLGIAQEYRHSTIRVTFTVDARRSRVLAAKVIVSTLFGAGIGLVAGVACYGAARLIFAIRHVAMSLTSPGENLSAFVGQIVLCALFTLAGFGLGAIFRQPAAAIPVLFLWPLIGEQAIMRMVLFVLGAEDKAKWLPFQAGLSLPVTGLDRSDDLSRVSAGLWFAVFVVVLVALGWLLVERRDA